MKIVAPLLGLAMLGAVAADAESKDVLTYPSTWNFSKWSTLSPAENQQRARFAVLARRLAALERLDAKQAQLRRARAEARSISTRLEMLADLAAGHRARAQLGAEIAAALRVLEAELGALEPAPKLGAITGKVGYPGCAPPRDLEVCAAPSPGEAPVACAGVTRRPGAEPTYRLRVPDGRYVVYAQSPSMRGPFRAFYSRAVECGLEVGCDDHRPIEVLAARGTTVRGVVPADWFMEPVTSPSLLTAVRRR